MQLTRSCQRVERVRRCGIGNETEETVRQTDHLTEPGEGVNLELCTGRSRSPQHCIDVERRRQRFAKHTRSCGTVREVRHEIRVIPMRVRGYYQFPEVGQDRVH